MSENGASSRPPLRILLCAPRGFCAGVDRAIQIVELALERFGAPVYVRHEIVHNRYVVEDLKAKGAVFVEELDEIPDTEQPVIFSAHGVPKSVPEAARARNLFQLDATCPLVTKVHREAEILHRKGREIVLDRPCRPSRGGRHHGPVADGRRLPGRDRGGRRGLHAAGPGPARLDHPDDAVGRRHRRDRRDPHPPLPQHRRPAQGRHLLCDDQPPGVR